MEPVARPKSKRLSRLAICVLWGALLLATAAGVSVAESQPGAAANTARASSGLLGATPTPPACGPAWRVVSGPSHPSASLDDVAVISPTDVWAVGSGLIEHWDGTQLSTVEAPGGLLLG